MFLVTRREEISLLKNLALAEVASDVNRATCSVQWARIISPDPQKQARRPPQCKLLLQSWGLGWLHAEPRGRNTRTFRDLKTLVLRLNIFIVISLSLLQFYIPHVTLGPYIIFHSRVEGHGKTRIFHSH